MLRATTASAETLLSAAAIDRMHDGVRTDYNKELRAQGVGNLLCGFAGALPMTVTQVQDVGTHVILSVAREGQVLKARLAPDATLWAPGDAVWMQVMGPQTCFYQNEEIVA